LLASDENMTGKAPVSSLAGPPSDLPTLCAAQAVDPASSSTVNYSLPMTTMK